MREVQPTSRRRRVTVTASLERLRTGRLLRGRSDLPFALLVVYVVVELLPDVDVVGFSLHFELVTVIGVLTLANWRLTLDAVPRTLRRPLVSVLVLYGAFVTWSALARLLRGESMGDVAERIAARHGVAVVGLLAIITWVTSTRRLYLLLAILAAVVVLHTGVAALQAAQVDQAWDLWQRLERWAAENPEALEGAQTRELPPGLTGGAFVLAYYAAILVPFLLVLADADRRRARGATAFAALAAFTLVVRERALLVIIAVTTVAWQVYGRSLARRLGVRLRGITAMLTLIVAASLVLLTAAVAISSSESPEGTDLGARFLDLGDSYRADAVGEALSAGADAPLLGNTNEDVTNEDGLVLSPHNMFLNALVFEGVPGLLLVLATAVAMLWMLHACVVTARTAAEARLGTERIWLVRVAVAGTVGVIGYLANAQLHNASLQSGDFLPWWALAIVLAAAHLSTGERGDASETLSGAGAIPGRRPPSSRGDLAIIDERERALAALLQSDGVSSLVDTRVVDLGCGQGDSMRTLIELGADPARLTGIDAEPDRFCLARRRLPGSSFVRADGGALPVRADALDVVSVFTLFSSIETHEARAGVAAEIDRVLRPGGLVVWYDLRIPNPANPSVSPPRRREVQAVFPGYRLRVRGVTVLPPLARRLGRFTPMLYPVLAAIPVTRTHLVGVLTKSGRENGGGVSRAAHR